MLNFAIHKHRLNCSLKLFGKNELVIFFVKLVEKLKDIYIYSNTKRKMFFYKDTNDTGVNIKIL
jgi:hypothetical protein